MKKNNFYKNLKIMFIDQVEEKRWGSWKVFNNCSEKEKNEANLRSIHENEIVLDIEDKNYEKIKEKLIKDGYNKFVIYDTGSRGVHFHLFFLNMPLGEKYKETRKKIRKAFIKKYGADESKASEDTLISIVNTPHFKTKKLTKEIFASEGKNLLEDEILNEALKEKVFEFQPQEKNKDFENFFVSDPFWNFISNTKIPDGTNRDMVVFPSLAIACFESGKTPEEIKEIVEPVIKKNFPGKIYAEFEGWLKKAFSGEIKDYNKSLLNKWYKENFEEKENFFYNLSPIEVESLEEILKQEGQIEKHEQTFFWFEDLDKVKSRKTEWLVEDWIPVGDICFIAGKAASYKSTICCHFALAISEGHQVFNKYKVKESKVLYINEENSKNIMLSIIERVSKGLYYKNEKKKSVSFSFLENLRIDEGKPLSKIYEYVKENNIKVLILDSFRRFIGFDENNATEMNCVFNNLKTLRKAVPDLTIIILHHLKKENGTASDLRDMLRGSSDIVNSADSIIGISRKRNNDAVKVFHIKNRSGVEVSEKVIALKPLEGEKIEDSTYIFETDDLKDKERVKKAEENCADKISLLIDEKKLSILSRKDLTEIQEEFSYDILTKALRLLIDEGAIAKTGSGNKISYVVK